MNNIIVNDFDNIRSRIYLAVLGHRTDLCLAALHSVYKDVEAMHLRNWDVIINRADSGETKKP
jgi:hypothetical protein